MIFDRFFEGGLHAEKPIVDRTRIVSVECDHLSTRLAAANDLEGVSLDAV